MNVEQLIHVVSQLATRQHGLVRTDQFGEEDQRRLRYLAKRGVLTVAGRGVYRVSGAPPTWLQRLTAGLWSLGNGAVVSHLAAAQLHRFDSFDSDAVEFCVPRSQRGRSVTGAVVHSVLEPIARRDVIRVQGLAATGAGRTIVDLARAGAPHRRLERAVDSSLALRLTTLPHLTERVESFEGAARRGVARLVPVLVSSGGHSYLERKFLALVLHAGLPRPQTQVVHRDDGQHVARVDFLFAEHHLVVEVSGGRGHSTAHDRGRDADRRNRLQRLGRTVLEFTFEMVINNPDRVVATLRDWLNRPTAGAVAGL